ncbi:MAG: UDP-N-acetylglucosamine diphosphorylase/glucosamine-1-phosphate N-acetyltransferase [Ferrovum sp.]|nr:UDP-N-acetylglucosamine diphosphorylase/glucosamine-1-phosphate N-acetyltransferase [Ferrovum sp.]NDU87976.1 UDP-N-acetylglucosamine diphosphorylase/glucosamine-1-phosphate N-acetyltransferase [Ferrovum sp.]
MNSSLPKVLQPLAAKPLLSHVLDISDKLRPDKKVVVFGHGGEQVQSNFSNKQIEWAHQAQQMGTGHAAAQALPYVHASEVVLILYGDVPLLQAETLLRMVSAATNSLVLLTQTVMQPQGYGRILRDSRGQILGIREEKDATPEERAIREINTGIMALPSRYLSNWLGRLTCDNAQKEYYLTDIVACAVADGVAVATVNPEYEWEALGVNDKIQLAQLERIYQTQAARKLMESGVTIADPEHLTVRGEVTCGKDVFLDVGVVLEGNIVLEDKVSIGPYCVLKNCHIGVNTVIQAYTHVEGAQLGSDNKIGPYARIRPGTQSAQGVHVGNFVEIKNSHIGVDSKANHLSYIGDSTVGARVNVGAGTITCNYDGVNKHRTVIEDDVFIGSDTQLVAPVTVEAGATIGAGSTIVTKVPAHQLTLSRSRQVTIPQWVRPKKKT